AGRLSLEVGAGDRGEEAEAGGAELDGKVAAEGEMNPGIEEPVPGVRAGKARPAEALLCPGHIAGAVSRVHRGDDAKLSKARNVGRVDNLGVLDPKAGCRSDAGAGVGVEHVSVGCVPDGVGRDLIAGGERAAGDLLDLARGSEDEPRVVRV